MPGRWDHLPPGTLTPSQVTRLVQDLAVAYALCPPGSLPTPPSRYAIAWSIAGLGVRPARDVIDQAPRRRPRPDEPGTRHTRHVTTDPADIERRLVQMSAFFAATGHPADQSDVDRGRRILTGAITYEDAYAELLAVYTQPEPQQQ